MSLMVDELDELVAQGDGRPGYKGLDFMNWPKRDGIRADPGVNTGIVPPVRNEPLVHENMEDFFPVWEAISALTAQEQEMISLVYFEKAGWQDSANVLGISIPMLKKKIAVALAKMKVVLEEPPVVKVKVKKDLAHFRLSGNFPLATKETIVH